MMNDEKYLLTVREAAEVFGIGQHTLRGLAKIDYNRVYSVTVGNRLMFKRDRLRQYIDKSESIPSYTI